MGETLLVESERTEVLEGKRALIAFLREQNIDITEVHPDPDGTIRPASRAAEAVELRPLIAPQRETTEIEIGETIGAGGMGVVKRAQQRRLHRRVAVKLVRPGLDERAAAGQIVREALVTGALEHPNIVPVHTLTWDEHGQPALVMKHIEGIPWRDLIDRDDAHHAVRSTARTALELHLDVLMQVCNAVHFAHDRGIVHRDLKPGNVMLGRFGEVYVLDWGIAVSIKPESAHLCPPAARVLAGTPGYMAPEMAACEPQRIGVHTDVYMLGAILHRLVTGHSRHEADSLLGSLSSAFRSARVDYDDKVPRELAEIANKAMSLRPEDRHESADAFRQAIATFLHHEASRELAEAARERLTLLEARARDPQVDPAEIHKLSTEARFAFQQVQKARPDDPEVGPGLERVLLVTIEFHLGRHDRDAARALLSELERPPASLTERFTGLERTLSAREAEIASLEALARGQDVAVDARQRARTSWLLAAALLIMIGVLATLRATGLREPGYPEAVVTAALFAVLAGVAGRVRYRAAEIGNKMRMATVATVGWLALHLLFCWYAGLPYYVGLSTGMLTTTLAVLVVGLTLHRSIIAMAPPLALAALGVLAWPSRPGIPMIAGTVTAFVVVAVISRRQAKPED